MKNMLDYTSYNVNDLGEQPKGLYLFRAEVGKGESAVLTLLWCDDIIVGDKDITVLSVAGTESEIIARFPVDCAWMLVTAAVISVTTRREMYAQMGRGHAAQEEARKIFTKAYEQATGTAVSVPIPPPHGTQIPVNNEELGPMNWDDFLKQVNEEDEYKKKGEGS